MCPNNLWLSSPISVNKLVHKRTRKRVAKEERESATTMMLMTRTHAPSKLGSFALLSRLLPVGRMCQLDVLRIWHSIMSVGSLRLPIILRGGNAFSAAANAGDTNRAAQTFSAIFGVDVPGSGSYVDGFNGAVAVDGIPADGKELRRCWSHKWRNRA